MAITGAQFHRCTSRHCTQFVRVWQKKNFHRKNERELQRGFGALTAD
jgi:hypothetical protein